MAPKKKENLRYNFNEMVWQNADGETVTHPRYCDRPKSLDSRTFMRSYLNAVRQGESLNEFMRTNQKFPASEVQKAARKMRKAYIQLSEANNAKDTFPLLKQIKEADPNEFGKDVASLLVELGLKNPGHPAITGSKTK
jgi:restriction endonuclease Mrr